MKVLIPSYKRDEVTTLSCLPLEGCEVIIGTQRKEDFDKLSSLYPNVKVILNENITNVAMARQSLLDLCEDYEKVVFLDDDISGFLKAIDASDTETETVELSPEEVLKFFHDGFGYCSTYNALVWGVYPVDNEYMWHPRVNIDNRIPIGTVYGLIKNSGLSFDPRFYVKEDYKYGADVKALGYECIRLNRYAVKAKHFSKGGCQDSWRDINLLESIQMDLCREYPNYFATKVNSKRSNLEVRQCFKQENLDPTKLAKYTKKENVDD